MKDVSSLSVSVGSDREPFIAHSSWCDLEGGVPSLFGNSFFIHSVARESVLILNVDRTQFSASPLSRFCSWILVLLGSSDEGVFSVLVVNDGDSEIVSFFGRASFVLYLRSVEDRMCT